MLSQAERWYAFERSVTGFYRWYIARSQELRNWNADLSLNWRELRGDLSDSTMRIVEGYYAVEQFIPDYVSKVLNVIRESYGRSQFYIRWGSEEERHADLWRNVLLFSGRRSEKWLHEYNVRLRGQEWHLPWDEPFRMVFYTVFQERATQVNYLNLGLVAKGDKQIDGADDTDPVLAQACRLIAIDEAAHYNFFLELSRLILYYFPEEGVAAMYDIVKHFMMPAHVIIPDYEEFTKILHKAGVFGLRQHSRDVVQVVLSQFGIEGVKALEAGIRRSRDIPDFQGDFRSGAYLDSMDYGLVEKKVTQLHARVTHFEESFGRHEFDQFEFVENPELTELAEYQRQRREEHIAPIIEPVDEAAN